MTQLSYPLGVSEVQTYQQQGYLLYHHQLFAADKQARLNSIFEEHLANKGSKLSDELDTPHQEDARLLEFLLSEEVLNLVEPLIGPDIVLWSSHFICKDPYVGRATPWHEDSAYWKGRVDNYEKIVTVWLALDRVNQANGCMRVIPGSHSNGFSDYQAIDGTNNTFDREVINVDEERAVYFELEPGESSLHDSRIIHGANANTSAFRRCGYTMRYVAASTKIIPERNQGHKCWLARGRNLAGNKLENV